MSTLEDLEKTYKKDLFYRDASKGIVIFIAIEILAIVTLVIGFFIYMNTYTPADKYFVRLPDGERSQLVALNYPNMTRVALLSWVSQSTAEIMTFGFHDFNEKLMATQRHFTEEGWESFRGALLRSGTIENLEKYQQIVTAVPSGVPILMQEGLVSDKYRWTVKMPLLVTFKVGNKSRPRRTSVTLIIEKIPTAQSIYGVGIQQWIAH